MRNRAYLLAVLLLLSCGKPEDAKIAGQVFVVTNGKENIKLALVEVFAIQEIDIEQHIKTQHTKGLAQQKLLLPGLESTKKEADKLWSELEKSTQEFYLESHALYQPGKNSEIDALIKNLNIDYVNKLAGIWDASPKNTNYKKMKSKFDYFDSPQYYFQNLPTAVRFSKTDADGKFTLPLPVGKYVIAATSNRKVIKDTELYYWLIKVDTALPNQSLMLSNDNLVETKCKECVKL